MWSFVESLGTAPARFLAAAASIVVGIAVAATVVGADDPAPTTSVDTTPSVTMPTPSQHDLLCNPLRDRYGQAMRNGGVDAAEQMRDAGAAMIQLGC